MSKIKKTRAAVILIILITFLFFLFILIYFNPSYSKHFRYLNFDRAVSIISTNNFFSDYKTKNEKKIRYFVQLGVFAKPNEVDKIRARLSLLGIKANYDKYILGSKLTTKITLGPYNKNALVKTVENLKLNNMKYRVINE